MKNLFLGLALLGLLTQSCQKNNAAVDNSDLDNQSQVIPNQYVVVLKAQLNKRIDGLNYQQKVEAMRVEAGTILNSHEISADALQLAYNSSIRGFSATLTEQEVQRLRKDDNVSYILEDRIFTLGKPGGGGTPNPESIPYGIQRVGYGNGAGKTAWIIDTGVDLDHPDLNVAVELCANFTRALGPDDDHGHGTHCAGTVAAIDNEIGVVGVAAGANVVGVKVLDRRGSGSFSWIIAGVDYVAANASPGDAVNMSLGGGVYQPIDDAVIAASNQGLFFALAAGNESDDANNHSPARANAPNIWTVSAMDSNDNFAYFSNYGSPVDYCMPGVNVYSTYKDGGYATMSGTSMASPHMCGVLLMTNGQPKTSGYVKQDPDGNPDPIGHL